MTAGVFPDRPTFVYILHGADDAILYVGVAHSPLNRFKQHAGKQAWFPQVRTIRMEHYQTRNEAEAREVALIQEHQPRHNCQHRAILAKEDRRRAARNPPRTHCSENHALTPENTYIAPNGSRVCRECRKAYFHDRQANRNGDTPASTPSEDAEVMTLPEAARYLGIAPGSLRTAHSQGRIAYSRYLNPRMAMISRDEVLRYERTYARKRGNLTGRPRRKRTPSAP